MKTTTVFVALLCFISLSKSDDEVKDKEVALGIIKGSYECHINKMPEVKTFMDEDLPYYHNVHFISVGGHEPTLITLNKDEQEIERIDLSAMSRQQCNDLLEEKGFQKKETPKVDWPEEDEDEDEEPTATKNDEL